MTIYNWIIVLLLVFGWGVTLFIANRTHKKSDRVNLINKKNDMLRDLEAMAIPCWEEGFNDIEKMKEVIMQTQRIRSIYEEMEKDHKDAIPPVLDDLRPAVTFDIESEEELGHEELSSKRSDIKKIIVALRSIPVKFKKFSLNLG